MNTQKLITFIKKTKLFYILFLFFTSYFLITIPSFSKNQKLANKDSKSIRKVSQRTINIGKLEITKAPQKEVSIIMSDPLMKKKWDLQKTNAKEAWLKFSKGSKEIVVAVIDTGIDTNHPDLKANIWRNPKEKLNNIDDDGNGFVDDIHGWNFVKNNNKVGDTHGHGTHIAGIIGAVGGNGIGLSGVAPKVSLMALKYYTPQDDGKNNLNNTVKAIQYAIENGAHIINYSGGGLEGNEKEKEIIKKAALKKVNNSRQSILFVAAAGNEQSNMDKKKYYPASYQLSNILPVTATDPSDKVLKSSNWGKTVHKSAPGINILSTLPGGKYGRMTGTSQATAVATGAAVLIMDYYKNKNARFVIKHLKMTGDVKENLKGKTSQGRRLNIFKALQARGYALNFMDEKVDTTGKIFSTEREIPADVPTMLSRDLADIDQVQRVLYPEKKDSENQKEKKVKREDTNVRNPSSPEHKAKIPFLKRWFLK